jgi:signal transduction histidine kinase/ActR/RegA family two-component response regulator
MAGDDVVSDPRASDPAAAVAHDGGDARASGVRKSGARASGARTSMERRSAFLAEASTLLASALHYEATLEALARLCVPTLADLCVIDMLADDGSIRRVAAAHADPDKTDVVRRLRDGFPPDVGGPHPVATVLRTGRAEMAPAISGATLARIAQESEHRDIAAALWYTSYIVVPFVARGRTLGALSLVSGSPERRYTDSDLALALDLARRAALAVDNARLYSESEARRHAAEALAETGRLLSRSLDVAEVAARVAGSVRTLIGGNPSIVYQVDSDTGDYVPLAISGDAGPAFGTRFRIPAGVGAIGLAMRERAPVATADLTADSRIELDAATRARLAHAPHRAALAVPLTIQGAEVGAILVGDRPGRTFTREQVALVQAFADQAALALENARLYEEATRRREAEEAARAAAEDANRAKDEFLATLSHELRTPLTAVLGWARLLRSHEVDGATAARALASIERNTQVLTQLIDDLLDVSRIISGKLQLDPRPLELAGVIDGALDAVRSASEAKGVDLAAALDPSAGPVLGDPARLQQVVWNLLSNAVKFTPVGGRVEVTLDRTGDEVRVSVRDEGCGISPEFLPYIFDRFRQAETGPARRHGGLGLGLAIARELVQMHGGTIRAASGGEGRGSVFTVALPRLRAAARFGTSAAAESRARAQLHGLSVLVVDDEADARDLAATALRQAGAQVLTAGSVADAMAILDAFVPDAVVSDLAMPGEDGYELLARLRALPGDRARVPVLATTAFARGEDRDRALAAGFVAHVPKPVEPAMLCRAVASVARRQRAA